MPTRAVNGTKIYYEDSGQGPPLLLIHGLGASAEDWDHQIPAFSPHYRVIVPDLRGFGRTPRNDERLSMPGFAADLRELLRQLGINDGLRVVGHSMGGAVALQLALDHPGLITRMVIANSVPSFRPRTVRQKFEITYRLIVTRLLGPKLLAQISASRMYPGDDQAGLREEAIARSRYNTSANYSDALRALVEWSVIDRLSELTLPVLVIASEHDYFSRRDSLSFAHWLPRGRYQLFEGRHHGLPQEAPEEFNPAVSKFLNAA